MQSDFRAFGIAGLWIKTLTEGGPRFMAACRK